MHDYLITETMHSLMCRKKRLNPLFLIGQDLYKIGVVSLLLFAQYKLWKNFLLVLEISFKIIRVSNDAFKQVK